MNLDLICVQTYASMFVSLAAPGTGNLLVFVARQQLTLHDTENTQCVTSVHINALAKLD